MKASTGTERSCPLALVMCCLGLVFVSVGCASAADSAPEAATTAATNAASTELSLETCEAYRGVSATALEHPEASVEGEQRVEQAVQRLVGAADGDPAAVRLSLDEQVAAALDLLREVMAMEDENTARKVELLQPLAAHLDQFKKHCE